MPQAFEWSGKFATRDDPLIGLVIDVPFLTLFPHETFGNYRGAICKDRRDAGPYKKQD